jgi:glycosyltransferase involved in cell wall biosynthesis
MKRLAIVASHVIQYQAPFFRLLAREPDIELTVIYCSSAGADPYRDEEMKTTVRWDIDLLQGYRHVLLRNFGFGDRYGRLINPGIVPALARGRFDAVIFMFGWGSVTALLGLVACRALRIPSFLYGDSSFPPPETTWRARLRARFVRAVFRLATGFMTSGELNAEYYRHYGGDPKTFFLLPWAVDNERFAEAGPLSDDERRALRARYGIGDEAVFLFSAKLLPRKDPMTLLRAYERMQQRARAAVIFMGEGELRPRLEQYAREHALGGAHFIGFVNQSALPRHYAMANVFVLPSVYEPRGAVVNEAMAGGLPVVTTDRCGSIGDIVLDGENAFVYPAGDADALAAIMDRLAADGVLRARMAERSREIIATWDYRRGVEGVKEMLRWV